MSGLDLRPIPGFGGYFADKEGRIYSNRWFPEYRVIKAYKEVKGYYRVFLRSDKFGRVRRFVHHLVLAAFYPDYEPPTGYQVRHLDGDPGNNRLDNLQWGTASENWEDRKAHQKVKVRRSPLNADQVRVIRQLYDQKLLSQRQLARAFECSDACIGLVVSRKSHSQVV